VRVQPVSTNVRDAIAMGIVGRFARRLLHPACMGALLLAVAGCGSGDETARVETAEDVLASFPLAPEGTPRWSYQATLDLGDDDGRPLGTLFQLNNAQGQLLAAAGFVHGMQTTASNDGRALNFFVGANSDPASRFSPVSMPTAATQPFGAGDLFLMSTFRGKLLAYRYHQPGGIRVWDEPTQTWSDYRHPALVHAVVSSVRNIQTVDNRLLVSYEDGVWFDNRPLDLTPLGVSSLVIISMAEYSAGVFNFSVVGMQGNGDLQASVVSCQWSAADGLLRACRASNPPMAGGDSTLNHLPSGLHRSARGTLLTYGLQGEVFELEDNEWTPLRTADSAESWQAYASLDAGHDVLLGHYPSGNLYALGRSPDDSAWELAAQDPPITAVAEVRRDEAQSLMHFGGEVLVGIWPWGEIFKGLPGEHWEPFIQAFSRSGGEPDFRHPYEPLVGNNCLGQRIFQILPWQTGFVFSTTLKNNDEECLNAIAAITAEQRIEYGQVRFVQRNHALTCPFVWVTRPTRLVLALSNDNRLFVSQDGRLLCSTPFEGEALAQALTLSDNVMVVGSPSTASAVRPVGLYGPSVH
jgi:hypothetical protein